MLGKLAAPRLSLGRFSLTADIKDGTSKVTKLGPRARTSTSSQKPGIPLRDPVLESPVDANFRFRVSDAYRGKNDSTKALFGAPGTTIPGVLDLDPKMKQAKRADGFYAFHARGPLDKLDLSSGADRAVPALARVAGGAAAAASARPKATP